MGRLDFKTILYLLGTGVTIEHEKKYTREKTDKNVCYIFSDYDEFKSYFDGYSEGLNQDIIDLAIYTRSSHGSIVALKGLCDQIITSSRIEDKSLDFSQQQISATENKIETAPVHPVMTKIKK